MSGRWLSMGNSYIDAANDRLYLSPAYNNAYGPILLKNFRSDVFQATFSVRRAGGGGTLRFVFNAKDQDWYNYITISHGDPGAAPTGWEFIDGAQDQQIATGSSATDACPNNSDVLWVRVQHDGSSVTVKTKKSADAPDWDTVSACFTSSSFTNLAGGMIGFTGNDGLSIDDLTVRCWDGDSWEVELVDSFTQSSAYAQDTPTHDKAGNLTYDGLHKYIYDPWNRLAQIKRAYRDTNNDLIVTSTVGTIQYDGSNRRIVKTVENSGDWNNEYHFFYDGWSKVEERDSSGDVLKQHVWGTQYIDEIVQTCLNDDPADENESVCETKYWGLQDANFNLLAVIGDDGSFAERYEYTPYGQRTVFKEASAGDDPLLTAPVLESQRWKVSSVDQAYGICDIGHQGLFFDKEWGAYDNRYRVLGPTVARFFQRDPAGYVDGMSMYQYERSLPTLNLDFGGLKSVKVPWPGWNGEVTEEGGTAAYTWMPINKSFDLGPFPLGSVRIYINGSASLTAKPTIREPDCRTEIGQLAISLASCGGAIGVEDSQLYFRATVTWTQPPASGSISVKLASNVWRDTYTFSGISSGVFLTWINGFEPCGCFEANVSLDYGAVHEVYLPARVAVAAAVLAPKLVAYGLARMAADAALAGAY